MTKEELASELRAHAEAKNDPWDPERTDDDIIAANVDAWTFRTPLLSHPRWQQVIAGVESATDFLFPPLLLSLPSDMFAEEEAGDDRLSVEIGTQAWDEAEAFAMEKACLLQLTGEAWKEKVRAVSTRRYEEVHDAICWAFVFRKLERGMTEAR
jgi:hypothetical protein